MFKLDETKEPGETNGHVDNLHSITRAKTSYKVVEYQPRVKSIELNCPGAKSIGVHIVDEKTTTVCLLDTHPFCDTPRVSSSPVQTSFVSCSTAKLVLHCFLVHAFFQSTIEI